MKYYGILIIDKIRVVGRVFSVWRRFNFDIIINLIAFFLVAMVLSMLANIITYASADMIRCANGGESYLLSFLTRPNEVTERQAAEAVFFFMRTAAESVPFQTFFDQTLDADGMGILVELIRSPQSILADLGKDIKGHMAKLPQDLAVSTLSNFVFFAFLDMKEKLFRKSSWGVVLGIWTAAIFWILASNTFAMSLILVLKNRVAVTRQVFLYIGIIVFAIAFEVVIHGFAKKCKIAPLVLVSILKIITGIFRAFWVWMIVRNFFVHQPFFSMLFLFGGLFGVLILEKTMLRMAEKNDA